MQLGCWVSVSRYTRLYRDRLRLDRQGMSVSRYSRCILTGLSAWLAGKCVMIQSDCIVTGGSLGWKSVSQYNLLYRDKLRAWLGSEGHDTIDCIMRGGQ